MFKLLWTVFSCLSYYDQCLMFKILELYLNVSATVTCGLIRYFSRSYLTCCLMFQLLWYLASYFSYSTVTCSLMFQLLWHASSCFSYCGLCLKFKLLWTVSWFSAAVASCFIYCELWSHVFLRLWFASSCFSYCDMLLHVSAPWPVPHV